MVDQPCCLVRDNQKTTAGVKTYERKLEKSKLDKDHKKYVPLHLSKTFSDSQRREKKLSAKSNWYGQKQHVQDTENVKAGDQVPSPLEDQNKKRRNGG